jgi:3-methylcrotonyl-CoA carboxylase alpha subunit
MVSGGSGMFDKLLIANRGEIACRIIRSARAMGVRTVAVYSEADASALHVSMADEAYLLGGAAAADSYLRIDRILEAARRSGAGAIHPGYGFLSENADFAEACAESNIVFVGPPAAAIRAMGSKAEAKRLMADAGVPVVPGYLGASQDAAELESRAAEIGYPLMIKASAGGGGKGMRQVARASEFASALAAARREAMAAFGDDHVLLERYVQYPRHIEVQVFADNEGNVVHLFERDCSMQRRHQKVLEEAPAPGFSDATRTRMGAAACEAARAIGYRGAGTVEFIVDGAGEFFFMEMNTRLQVEHPVTEMITGIDLVEWQLQVAAGNPLPLDQAEIRGDGHAIEVRLYAEDPARDFLPAAGTLSRLRFPPQSDTLRIDCGVREGDVVSVHYDPMIAKIIVWDRDRDGACRRLLQAVQQTQLTGLTSNLDFLVTLAANADFRSGNYDTGFIARNRDSLIVKPDLDGNVLCLAALHTLTERKAQAATQARASADPYSPWQVCDGWRLNDTGHEELSFSFDGDQHDVIVRYLATGFEIVADGRSYLAEAYRDEDGGLVATLDGLRTRASVLPDNGELLIVTPDRSVRLGLIDPMLSAGDIEPGAGSVTAPMPGKIVQVLVAQGDAVEKNQPLVVLEAMKMEHTLLAPAAGTIGTVHHAVEDTVEEGWELLHFEPS